MSLWLPTTEPPPIVTGDWFALAMWRMERRLMAAGGVYGGGERDAAGRSDRNGATDMSNTTQPTTTPSDPDIGLLQSRTFWAAIITPIVATLITKFGLQLDNATVGAIDTLLTTLMMIGMRYVTNRAVTGVARPAAPK